LLPCTFAGLGTDAVSTPARANKHALRLNLLLREPTERDASHDGLLAPCEQECSGRRRVRTGEHGKFLVEPLEAQVDSERFSVLAEEFGAGVEIGCELVARP
jgi:hypothetical protein